MVTYSHVNTSVTNSSIGGNTHGHGSVLSFNVGGLMTRREEAASLLGTRNVEWYSFGGDDRGDGLMMLHDNASWRRGGGR